MSDIAQLANSRNRLLESLDAQRAHHEADRVRVADLLDEEEPLAKRPLARGPARNGVTSDHSIDI